jgi:mannose-6-phosphate isomerase-like protein (cupin superfamily)
MRLEHARFDLAKGWYAGPWNSPLGISVGYACTGVDEPHLHTQICEIYLIACGSAIARVGEQSINLQGGDMLVVEPGEPHTFLDSTPDYFHFVIHWPGVMGETARLEKHAVTHRELGLEDS